MLSGELEVTVDGQAQRVGEGALLHVPANAVHGYRNVTDCHFLTIVTRGQAAPFFAQVASEVEMRPPDVAGIVRVAGVRHRNDLVTTTWSYVSPHREARAAATAGGDHRSLRRPDVGTGPRTASRRPMRRRAAGVSPRTVHMYFPNQASQIQAVGEWYDQHLSLSDIEVTRGPDDLPRYFREVIARAMATAETAELAATLLRWPEVRHQRRGARLDTIRRAVDTIGAPKRATEDATALLLGMSGVDLSWPMHDRYGLPLDRIPDTIANAVSLIVEQLKSQAAGQLESS